MSKVMLIPGLVAFLLISLERFSKFHFREANLFRRYFTSDITYFLTGTLAGSSLVRAYVSFSSGWVGEHLKLPRLASFDLSLWLLIPLAVVALDLGNYFVHYLLHRWSFLWEFHKIHHSSRHLDWLATFRSHIIEQALRRLIGPAVLILVGFPIKAVVLASAISMAWGIFNHSNLRINFRFVESVLITPGIHRLHHVPETETCNLGIIFTFWDRLRGKFVTAETSPNIILGFEGENATYPQSWAPQLIEPFKQMVSASSTRTTRSAEANS